MMRVSAALVALAFLCGCGARADTANLTGDIRISATAVPLDPRVSSATTLGEFNYAGGLQLSSPDTARFGGLSDVRLDADGRLTAVSDDGDLLRAHLLLDRDRRLLGVDQATLRPMLGLDGAPLQGKVEGDAEGLAIWPNGDLMVSFERDHRIWIYPATSGPPRVAPMPQTRMGDNAGMEGLALAPSRGPDAYWVGTEAGSIWLCRLSGGCEAQTGEVRPPFGYRLTALAETSTGELVVLHHGYNPILDTSRMIIWITRPRDKAPAQVVAKLAVAPPLTVDNFEGVDVAALPGGGLRLFVLSDDNFNPKQRALLMAFDWTPPPSAPSTTQPVLDDRIERHHQ